MIDKYLFFINLEATGVRGPAFWRDPCGVRVAADASGTKRYQGDAQFMHTGRRQWARRQTRHLNFESPGDLARRGGSHEPPRPDHERTSRPHRGPCDSIYDGKG